MISKNELITYLDTYFSSKQYSDYCPNGLQIEGRASIQKLAFAVSATKYSINEAVRLNADALIVHHGLFWKFHGVRPLTNAFYNRVSPLIKNDINLIAYHLPLDGHPEIGNAAVIAKKLNLKNIKSFGDYKGMPTGVKGEFDIPLSPDDLSKKLETLLNHNIIHSKPHDNALTSIGIITGGANSNWTECLEHKLDAYLTGEMSEHDWHEAQESNIHFYAGGHNATEQFGVQALLKHLYEHFKEKNLECFYIPSDNPA